MALPSLQVQRSVDLLDESQTRDALTGRDRNLTMHTYNEPLANEITGRVPGHVRVRRAWIDAMQPRLRSA